MPSTEFSSLCKSLLLYSLDHRETPVSTHAPIITIIPVLFPNLKIKMDLQKSSAVYWLSRSFIYGKKLEDVDINGFIKALTLLFSTTTG